VLETVRAEIGDLYPPIPDPQFSAAKERTGHKEENLFDAESLRSLAARESTPPGFLTPVAYLWTRTVKCKNPACGATVPLVDWRRWASCWPTGRAWSRGRSFHPLNRPTGARARKDFSNRE